MKLTELDTVPCPVAQAVAVIGDPWTILILRDAFKGLTRFDAIQKSTRASRALLVDRLNRLIESGVMEKLAYANHPPRYDYRLTARGRALQPVMMTLAHWSETHLDAPMKPLGRRHTACGHRFKPVVHCSECGDPIRPGDVTFDRLSKPVSA